MKRITQAALLLLVLVLSASSAATAAEKQYRHDVLVVGAGIAGLSAVWELTQKDVDVAVIEMAAAYGGTGLTSEGALCIVGTPVQEQAGEPDDPQIAYRDFMTAGRDENGPGPDTAWVDYYVKSSRREIYDWLTGFGVHFEKKVILMPDNSVPRWHKVVGKGRGLLEPIYRECRKSGKAKFHFGVKAVSLSRDKDGRMTGVSARRIKDGAVVHYHAPVVILATGGFQSNLDMVRKHWPADLPLPDSMLIGGGLNATGSGHEMAEAAGARFANMHYQLNYPTGLKNPFDPSGRRGLNAYTDHSIWVNKTGKRFMSESRDTRKTFPEVARQPGGTYWAIFDDDARKVFHVSGWSREAIEARLFNNPHSSEVVKSAPTIKALAAAADLPPETLDETVRRWNEMVAAGRDADFGRIGASRSSWAHPPKIEKPPYYAVRFVPLTRKSMGGVVIDLSCRVLNASGKPIPGLYAVGELTGLAGVNGKCTLEGTFLGASILTGRVAGRAALTELRQTQTDSPPSSPSEKAEKLPER
ncbi:MAG: FAD-dependent oxidoreductase [Syntrophaceae bacterium]|nr:FAD-dependent oxidoreductase [Syntrophaceae bacterium]